MKIRRILAANIHKQQQKNAWSKSGIDTLNMFPCKKAHIVTVASVVTEKNGNYGNPGLMLV